MKAAEAMQDIAKINAEILRSFNEKKIAWDNEKSRYDSEIETYNKRDGKWKKFLHPEPGTFETGYTTPGGAERCREQGLQRTGSPYWIEDWHWDGNWGTGDYRRTNYRCRYDMNQSESDYHQREKPYMNPKISNPGDRPPYVPIGDAVICQDCRSTVNMVGNTDANAQIQQMNTCIANLTQNKTTVNQAPATSPETLTKTPTTPSPQTNKPVAVEKNNLWIYGIIAGFVCFIIILCVVIGMISIV